MIGELIEINQEIEALKARKSKIEEALYNEYKEAIDDQMKDYGCGTATLNIDGKEVKAVISKYVKWDDKILSQKAAELTESGADPEEYLKIKYSISESAYKNWPSEIQEWFKSARTVKPSKPKWKIKE